MTLSGCPPDMSVIPSRNHSYVIFLLGGGGGGGHGCVRPQLKKSGSIVVSFPHLGDEQ